MDGGRHLTGEAQVVNESGSSVLAANLDDLSGSTARLGSRRSDAITRSVPNPDRRRPTWDRCGRPPLGMPALGIPKLGGFPQVCAGCAACGCFWLNDSEEVRLDMHAMDVDTAEALAGVVGYFDRQRFALGLPRIGQGLDRLDSSSLSVSTRPGTWSRT